YEAERRANRGRRSLAGAAGAPGERKGPSRAGARSAGSPTGAKAPKQRSASTLRRLLQQADKATARLRERQEALEAELAGAGDDRVALARVGEELAEVQAAIAAAEEEWLALAEEAEAVGVSI
ncbi:MAG TPA: hypothetical protein VIL36_03560, partial [Acidimicrobiales bacterium]